MKITENTDPKILYNAGTHTMISVNGEHGVFIKYCGCGKINYKTPNGILKSVNAFTNDVYLTNW